MKISTEKKADDKHISKIEKEMELSLCEKLVIHQGTAFKAAFDILVAVVIILDIALSCYR